MASSSTNSIPNPSEPCCLLCFEPLSIADLNPVEEIFGKLTCPNSTEHEVCKTCSESWFVRRALTPVCPFCRADVEHLRSWEPFLEDDDNEDELPVFAPFIGHDPSEETPGDDLPYSRDQLQALSQAQRNDQTVEAVEAFLWGQRLNMMSISSAIHARLFSDGLWWNEYPRAQYHDTDETPCLVDPQEHSNAPGIRVEHITPFQLHRVQSQSPDPDYHNSFAFLSSINTNLTPVLHHGLQGNVWRCSILAILTAAAEDNVPAVRRRVVIDFFLTEPLSDNFDPTDPPSAEFRSGSYVGESDHFMMVIFTIRNITRFGLANVPLPTFAIAAIIKQLDEESIVESIEKWFKETTFCRCLLSDGYNTSPDELS
jgi:hypothetical protein